MIFILLHLYNKKSHIKHAHTHTHTRTDYINIITIIALMFVKKLLNLVYLKNIMDSSKIFLSDTVILITLYLIYNRLVILGVVKRNPLFFHSISCKNNGFLTFLLHLIFPSI